MRARDVPGEPVNLHRAAELGTGVPRALHFNLNKVVRVASALEAVRGFVGERPRRLADRFDGTAETPRVVVRAFAVPFLVLRARVLARAGKARGGDVH